MKWSADAGPPLSTHVCPDARRYKLLQRCCCGPVSRSQLGPATCLQGEANIEGIWTHILDTVSDPASGFPPALGEELAKNVSWHPPSGETQSLSTK